MPVPRIAAVFVAALSSLLVTCSVAAAAPSVTGHFPIPPIDGSNTKIAAGPDGNMWLPVKDGVEDVARIAPDGAVTEFELNGIEGPTGIAVGPENLLWVTAINKVASFSPSDPTGSSKAFNIVTVTANNSIVAGPDGQMWVAATENVVHFLPSDPEKASAFPVAGLTPKDIDVAGSGLVIADANNNRIVTMTTAGVPQNIPLLGSTSTAQGVAGSPGGQIAFSKSDATEGLGLVTPPNAPTAVEMPGDPFGVALGSDGAYWFAMSAANNVQRLAGDGKATPLNGFPPKFAPRQIAPGPNNTLWVTMENVEEPIYEVARISGLEPPVKSIPTGIPGALRPDTKIRKGPKKVVRTKHKRASVKFRFSSTTAGATFECALVKKAKKGKKTPKPKFNSCRSPKKLKLRPGRYRFSVRAVSGVLVDPTPATSSFRVIHIG
jgi:streptogramin lyase